MTVARAGLAGALVSTLLGCAALSPLPDTRTPADRARELENKCRYQSEESARAVLSPTAIESVEPYDTRNPAGNGHENRMLGARVHVAPLPGLTKESLELALQCHQARVTLGIVAPTDDDPYVLPGDWLSIDVDSEGNGFRASIYPVDYENPREVLARARRFARATK